MATAVLVVGYTTKTRDDIEMPEFTGNANTKDPDKIAEQIAEKQKAFMANASGMPYVGQLQHVAILDTARKTMTKFPLELYELPAAEPAKKKKPKKGEATDATPPPVATPLPIQLSRWIGNAYPNAWSQDVLSRNQSQVIFAGFNPRRFLKMLALECAEHFSQFGNDLPPGMWYGTSDYRDVEEAILPERECKGLTLDLALRKLGIDAAGFAPGVDPVHDVEVSLDILLRLGLIPKV